MALERRDGGPINKLSREWSPALECWTMISLHPKQRAENESGAQARPLTRAPQQIYVFIFLARSPRAPGDPGRHPKAIRWGFGDFPGPPGGPRHPPRPKPTKKQAKHNRLSNRAKAKNKSGRARGYGYTLLARGLLGCLHNLLHRCHNVQVM